MWVGGAGAPGEARAHISNWPQVEPVPSLSLRQVTVTSGHHSLSVFNVDLAVHWLLCCTSLHQYHTREKAAERYRWKCNLLQILELGEKHCQNANPCPFNSRTNWKAEINARSTGYPVHVLLSSLITNKKGSSITRQFKNNTTTHGHTMNMQPWPLPCSRSDQSKTRWNNVLQM